MKMISEAIDALVAIRDEFGEVAMEMYDPYDMDMRQLVTDVRFDADRQRVQILSDR